MNYSVWPTPAPPVCTVQWDQDSWRRWEARYRPDDYAGGQYDRSAWDAYRANRVECQRAALRAAMLGE